MGCDIHLHVEALKNGEWILIDKPKPIRNYELFEKIAGVRGETHNAIVQPKGLPKDISKGTAVHYQVEEPDAHTESWLDSSEIKLLENWYNQQECRRVFEQDFGFLFGNGYNREVDTPVDDWRFVFWFDN